MDRSVQRCYAVMADDGVRSLSSSGGAFTVLAKHVLSNGGCVCGAAFTDNWHCRYILAETAEGIAAMRGSKYVKSEITPDFLASVKSVLKGGRTVLFSGVPCQVAAMKNIFRDYGDLLTTVDLICAGTPSVGLFRQYLDENWGAGNIESYEFRNKSRGWRIHHGLIRVVLKDGREILRDQSEDEFMAAKAMGLSLMSGCFGCPFCSMRRHGDVTIGDFWNVPPEYDDGRGTSIVLVNTERGRDLFDVARRGFAKVVEFPPGKAEASQGRLRSSIVMPVGYSHFGELVRIMSVKEALASVRKDVDRNVAVLNFHWETVNFGAVLTAYALSRGLREMGYEVRNIDFKPDIPRVRRKPPNAKFDEFRRRHIPVTNIVKSAAALSKLNERFGSFMVGSDQVWNPKLSGRFLDVYFLTFAKPGRRLVASAASFGSAPVKAYGAKMLRKLLSRFDAVGVREKSAADALSGIGLECSHVADPVFLLDRSTWLSLASGASGRQARGGDVVCYAVSPFGKDAFARYAERFPAAVSGRLRFLDANLGTGVEDWLASVSRASLVLADSFHAVCFALIFGRPFAFLTGRGAEPGRVASLLESVGLKGRVFTDVESMPSPEELSVPLDEAAVANRLAAMRGDLARFLKDALERPAHGAKSARKLRRSAVRALLWRELPLLARQWLGLARVVVRMMFRVATGRGVEGCVPDVMDHDDGFSGHKRTFRRLLGQFKETCRSE